jgi:hypothetical protein
MNQSKQVLFLIATLLICTAQGVFPQDTQDKPFLEKGTVEEQFNFLYDKSYTFEIFKSIRIPWYTTLKSHVLDSLKSIKKELRKSQQIALSKDSQLDSLKSALEKTKQDLATVTNEKNSFRLFGILMAKGSYNSLVWIIILILSVLLALFVLLFKRSNSITSQTKTSLSEVKDEFETFRKRSLEREEKMARKHLDEMNKYKK